MEMDSKNKINTKVSITYIRKKKNAQIPPPLYRPVADFLCRIVTKKGRKKKKKQKVNNVEKLVQPRPVMTH